jgi:hypothetical protein
MGRAIGGKSRDTRQLTIAISPRNDNDLLGIGAQFKDRETLYDGGQDHHEYDPNLFLLRALL